MSKKRLRFTVEFEKWVALEALRGRQVPVQFLSRALRINYHRKQLALRRSDEG